MIWITSDTHGYQRNIIRKFSSWEDTDVMRDFESIPEMNAALIEGINKYVKVDDTLYHLGDFTFGKEDNIAKFRARIKCRNIHLILGNHDHYLAVPNSECTKLFSSIRHYRHISPKLPPLEGNPNTDKWKRQVMILSHYPMRVWEQSHRGAWMLHGHCHGSLFRNRQHRTNAFYESQKTFDVGVDHVFELFGEYRPMSVIELREIMLKRLTLNIDHHRPKK